MATRIGNGERRQTVCSKKFIDRAGTTNPHGVKFLEFKGFVKNRRGEFTSFGAWEVECPLCQKHFEVWSTAFNRVEHCGCGRKRYSEPMRKLKLFWANMRNSDQCCAEWKNWDTFYAAVPEIPDHMQMFRPDHRRPLGPDNFLLGRKIKNCRWINRIWISHDQILMISDVAYLLGCSRQNIWSMNEKNLQARLDAELAARKAFEEANRKVIGPLRSPVPIPLSEPGSP